MSHVLVLFLFWFGVLPVPIAKGACTQLYHLVSFVCLFHLFIYLFLYKQVSFTRVVTDYLYSVLLSYQSVSSVASGVPRELCAHDVLHKHTLMRACMFDHSSKAAIIASYFRLE